MLLEYVQKKRGYVRIIVPLYGTNARFDITIPCLNNPQKTE